MTRAQQYQNEALKLMAATPERSAKNISDVLAAKFGMRPTISTVRTWMRQQADAERYAENVRQADALGIEVDSEARIWYMPMADGRQAGFYPHKNEWIKCRVSDFRPSNFRRWHGDLFAFAEWLENPEAAQ